MREVCHNKLRQEYLQLTKGITFLQIFSIDRFAILQATYRFAPTGGVTIPTAKLLTIKIPNAYLSYPIEVDRKQDWKKNTKSRICFDETSGNKEKNINKQQDQIFVIGD